MLEKNKNQENKLIVYLVVSLIMLVSYLILIRGNVDGIYVLLLVCYFVRFLRVNVNRR